MTETSPPASRPAGSHLTIHSPESFRAVPWRNGRGETLVMLAEPLPGSDHFAWRLSIATVDTDGPFSLFSACDRTLLLLEGSGITLSHDVGRKEHLNSRFAMADFSGDWHTTASLHDGPIQDFNVIWNRNRCSTRVSALDGCGDNVLGVDADKLLVYAVDEALSIRAPAESPIEVDARHLLQYDRPVAGRWTLSNGPAIAIQIRYMAGE